MIDSVELSIIIVNWKSQAFIKECLKSICANVGTVDYEVFVVDNASYDGCDRMVHAEFPHVLFIQCEQNLGFAAANNLAFYQSRGRNVMFLNPDTEIQGDAIQKLISSIESIANAGMVGARLLNTDRSIQTTCITSFPSIVNQALNIEILKNTFPEWKMWGIQPLFANNKTPVEVPAISGACMLARREVIAKIGSFSQHYFMYLEDMDLCVKINRAGWKIYYVPNASIVHHGGRSSAGRREQSFSNIMLRESLVRFFTMHRGRLYTTIYRISCVFMAIFRLLLLLAAFPIVVHPRGYRFVYRAVFKWCNILAWSVGLTRWANQQSRQLNATLTGS